MVGATGQHNVANGRKQHWGLHTELLPRLSKSYAPMTWSERASTRLPSNPGWSSPLLTSLSSVSFDSRYTSGSRFLVFLDFSSSYFFRKSSGVRENSAILTSKA